MTEREMELRKKINEIAHKGRAAAIRKDRETATALVLQIEPLLRELAAITQTDHWNELADRGMELYDEFQEIKHVEAEQWEQRR